MGAVSGLSYTYLHRRTGPFHFGVQNNFCPKNVIDYPHTHTHTHTYIYFCIKMLKSLGVCLVRDLTRSLSVATQCEKLSTATELGELGAGEFWILSLKIMICDAF